VSLRLAGKLLHLGIGRAHARTPVLILVQDLDIHIVNAKTGELIANSPSTPPRTTNHKSKKTAEPRDSTVSYVLRHHMVREGGLEPPCP
jgi:hypothetical protein